MHKEERKKRRVWINKKGKERVERVNNNILSWRWKDGEKAPLSFVIENS